MLRYAGTEPIHSSIAHCMSGYVLCCVRPSPTAFRAGASSSSAAAATACAPSTRRRSRPSPSTVASLDSDYVTRNSYVVLTTRDSCSGIVLRAVVATPRTRAPPARRRPGWPPPRVPFMMRACTYHATSSLYSTSMIYHRLSSMNHSIPTNLWPWRPCRPPRHRRYAPAHARGGRRASPS
jgi:hypothetical protein